ncbi:hypothetical protein CCR97_15820 [Rhodoplanes elegans]|uniref:Cytochrome C n=1 Tax=Rhodoplanes elegans TaxID=29408 RepID=A0A327KC10_9BRAD|nr:hypothetical protein [Rhodoplanes elegans]MBK5959662.1 hypothetical protein [Rhodoplanes elegans]RAI36330.1 hypothetical protein CH338_17760 [Rhodoplanes elegans]
MTRTGTTRRGCTTAKCAAGLLAGFALLATTAAVRAAPESDDPRLLITLPDEVRQTFLEHMRTHMTTLDQVLQLVGSGCVKEAGVLARKEMAIGQGLGIGRHMPAEFREMGFAFHRAADDFARVTQTVADPPDAAGWKSLMTGIAAITTQCAGCHGAYRVR